MTKARKFINLVERSISVAGKYTKNGKIVSLVDLIRDKEKELGLEPMDLENIDKKNYYSALNDEGPSGYSNY